LLATVTPVPGAALDEICKQLSATQNADLGSGNFKQAFLVDRGGKQYALKVARASAGKAERFEREAAALKKCTHENIAVLHDIYVFAIGGEYYWVSIEEYLAHGTLEKRLAGGVLDPKEVLRLARLLASAVEHLATHRFVHRDIKPANILFRDATTPVLTDFGIVRMLDEPSITADHMMQGPGTPMFAAPEQLVNDKMLIDWRTDQFGLALALAFAALGRHPFQPAGGNVGEAIEAVAKRVSLTDETRAELAKLGLGALVKALGVWPHERYATPEEMTAAFSVGA
jgi:serine/threonine protein kinase